MDRRDFLRLGLASLGMMTLPMTACARSSTPEGAVRVAQFGSAGRMRIFRDLFSAFTARHPEVVLALESASNSAYVDKLATQVSSGNAPTVLGLQYSSLPTFARQNALADLRQFVGNALDTSAFPPDYLSIGVDGDRLTGLSYGDNAFGIVYDEDRLAAAGKTPLEPGYSWDDFLAFSVDLTRAVGGDFWGTEDRSASFDSMFKIWLLQQGKTTFTDDGTLGFDEADLIGWLDYWQLMRDEGGTTPAPVTAEASGSFERSALIRGFAPNYITYSNAIVSMQRLTTSRLRILPLPVHGGAQRSGQSVRGSNWVGLFALADELGVAADFLNFVFNDPEGATILGAELGAPPNRELRAILTYPPPQQHFIDYIDFMSQGPLRDAPVPLSIDIPPAFNDVNAAFETAVEEVRFGRRSSSEAADWFFRTADRALETLQ
ncbi:ABC transporter substrate-binding protein [Saccharomonospora sp. NPDC046836]|uniref:ABC transporter substrate-binding protein n=1 Tax=Saccharomonospora sp. NPDC046836 TaxID=3156921 RepID=UPI0033FE7CC1